MGRKFKINWNELSKIGNDTSDLIINLEKARLRIKFVLDTMDEAWTGSDAERFKNSYYSLLDDLKEEITLLLEWSDYFDRSSKKYSSTEEEVNRDVSKIRVDIESMCGNLVSDGVQRR